MPTPAGPVRLSAVAGVTALLPDVDTGEALRRGDLALRSARTAGPGSVRRYLDALRIEQDRREALRTDLDGALDRGELRLAFQPVVDVVMQRTVSVEALLRWRHPLFGDVSPTEFVPLAEESPLITELGRWVLREACATIAGLGDTDLSVAVNVSARQVRSGELVPDVISALETSGLPARRLIVEITESVLLDDSHVIEDLTVLRQLGVRIAVDDFGTGWSSLAYLVGMPVDVLKMDQYFLANVEHDPARRAMCRAVLQLGSSLGLPVIVEGVTNPAVLNLLRDMGHRYLQGYVFARPLEAEQLADGAWEAWVELPADGFRHGGLPPGRIPGDAVMTASAAAFRAEVRWTVPLALLGLALTVPFSAPDGTGMQWDELVLGTRRRQLRLDDCSGSPARMTPQAARPWRVMRVGIAHVHDRPVPGRRLPGAGVRRLRGGRRPAASPAPARRWSPARCWPAGSAAPAGRPSSSTARSSPSPCSSSPRCCARR